MKSDIAHLRQRLDEMQTNGLDFLVIGKWRALLDAYVQVDLMRDEASSGTSVIELAKEDLERAIDNIDLSVSISGTLDDLQAQPGALSAAARKAIDDALEKACDEVAKSHIVTLGEIRDSIGAGIEELDVALSIDDESRNKAFMAKAAREKREREAAKSKRKGAKQ
jgi:hypothetical protein